MTSPVMLLKSRKGATIIAWTLLTMLITVAALAVIASFQDQLIQLIKGQMLTHHASYYANLGIDRAKWRLDNVGLSDFTEYINIDISNDNPHSYEISVKITVAKQVSGSNYNIKAEVFADKLAEFQKTTNPFILIENTGQINELPAKLKKFRDAVYDPGTKSIISLS